MDTNLLTKLVTTPGISGYEHKIREVVKEEMGALVDEHHTDALGNVIGVRHGSGPRVMFSAHMDSIGFLVSHIDDNGYLRISNVGGFDPRTLVMQRVMVHGKQSLPGLLTAASKPLHLSTPEDRNKAPKLEDIFIDLMLPADEVKANFSIGDPVTLYREPTITDRAFASAYLDDRVGVYILLEALRKAKQTQAELCAVISVQEEVGLRGARTGAFGAEPEIGVALDVSVASDTPGGDGRGQHPELGKGVGISLMDSSLICDPRLVKHFRELAEKHGIAHQMEFTNRGGTDGGAIQQSRAGVAAITISVPVRYIHSVNELAMISDIEATVDLMARFMESAHELNLSW